MSKTVLDSDSRPMSQAIAPEVLGSFIMAAIVPVLQMECGGGGVRDPRNAGVSGMRMIRMMIEFWPFWEEREGMKEAMSYDTASLSGIRV